MKHDFYGEITRESIRDRKSWLDVMVRDYIECALWSSTDESDESGGNPMNQNYDLDDISQETLDQAIQDCITFANDFHDCILSLHQQCKYDQGQAGHDLWLTRNGHGAGFWDRGLGESGDKMTAKAKSMGAIYLYIGDDGLIHG
jgi:hypothetical protein